MMRCVSVREGFVLVGLLVGESSIPPITSQ